MEIYRHRQIGTLLLSVLGLSLLMAAAMFAVIPLTPARVVRVDHHQEPSSGAAARPTSKSFLPVRSSPRSSQSGRLAKSTTYPAWSPVSISPRSKWEVPGM